MMRASSTYAARAGQLKGYQFVVGRIIAWRFAYSGDTLLVANGFRRNPPPYARSG